jgi:hypothetical protein
MSLLLFSLDASLLLLLLLALPSQLLPRSPLRPTKHTRAYTSKFQKGGGGIIGNNVLKQAEEREERYYIGIIDILTQYGTWKSAETFFKSFSVTEVCFGKKLF